MAYTNGNDEICSIINNLSNFFRLSLKTKGKYYTIENEVEHVKSYIAIQKKRFKNKINYAFDVDNDILPCKMVKTVIQPLVENSILHGLADRRRGGKIDIKINGMDDKILISVSDNGKGIPGSLADKNNWRKNNHSGHGLYNVHERIRLFFGKEYGLEIRNNKNNEGCTVTITIPKQIKEDGDEEADENIDS
jgi:two-component system sensor histidine kinase YesM